MPFLDILGYIAFGITWLLAFSWALGIRLRNVISTTVMHGEILLAIALIFTFSTFSNLHLFWLVPLSFLLTLRFSYSAGYYPAFHNLTILIAAPYVAIVRIGAKPPPPRARDF